MVDLEWQPDAGGARPADRTTGIVPEGVGDVGASRGRPLQPPYTWDAPSAGIIVRGPGRPGPYGIPMEPIQVASATHLAEPRRRDARSLQDRQDQCSAVHTQSKQSLVRNRSRRLPGTICEIRVIRGLLLPIPTPPRCLRAGQARPLRNPAGTDAGRCFKRSEGSAASHPRPRRSHHPQDDTAPYRNCLRNSRRNRTINSATAWVRLRSFASSGSDRRSNNCSRPSASTM